MLSIALLLAVSGCRNKDLLETELRTQEIRYRELLDEFEHLKHRNHALEREVVTLRQSTPVLPELAVQTYALQRITIGRLTSGRNLDDVTGDDALYVIVEPRDGHDHVIKAPGAVQICALEITPHGIKVPLCSWDVPPDALRRSWKSGLFSSGYTLELPWQGKWPKSENLRVVARFTLSDGRVFEADRDIRIRCIPEAPDAGPVLPEGDMPGGPPLIEEQQPAPTKLPPPMIDEKRGPSLPPPEEAPPPRSVKETQAWWDLRRPRVKDAEWKGHSLAGKLRLQRPIPITTPGTEDSQLEMPNIDWLNEQP